MVYGMEQSLAKIDSRHGAPDCKSQASGITAVGSGRVSFFNKYTVENGLGR
jgi:hypothetical protein